MNDIVKPITEDGRTGFDKFGQLFSWSKMDGQGNQRGRVIADVRGAKCYICDRGWEPTSDSLQDQCRMYGHFMHQTCSEGYYKIEAYRDISESLIKAGYLFHTEECDPRYPHSTPWQRVNVLLADEERTPSIYNIVLGRRKRVWDIHFHYKDVRPLSVETAFRDVEHTQGFQMDSDLEPEFGPFFYVHAWDKQELVEYLKRFRMLIPHNTNRESV